MAGPTLVFKLYRDRRSGRHLLLGLQQRAYSNASESEYNTVVREREEHALGLLPQDGEWELTGEMQCLPVGDILLLPDCPRQLEIWVARTAFGHPWVVLGSAPTQECFWQEVDEDEEEYGTPLRPAQKVTVDYICDFLLPDSTR